MAIAALLPSLLPVVGDVLDRFFPNKEEKARAEREIQAKLAEHLAKIDMAQIEVNKQEAAHRSLFVAGWRPFVGWTCGLALFYTYVGQPMAMFIMAQTGDLVQLPQLDLSTMMPVLLGMLGLGGLRTYEKFKGVSK
jgi:hypothetical protein|tara:strand:+ start:3852 stop:4259 length:408 start_codon:yes stop_codon:yes gene_type:complete